MTTEDVPPSKKDEIWLNNTVKLSYAHNSSGRVKMMALIVKSNRVLSVGKNKFHKKGITKNKSYIEKGIHAELAAIAPYYEYVHNSTLYVAGTTISGFPLKTTRPCPICMDLILATDGINKVVFFEDEKIKKIKITR